MNFKKRGLGRGLEALLADVSTKEGRALLEEPEDDLHDGLSPLALKVTEQSRIIPGMIDVELKKYQKVAEQSRKRSAQLQELQSMPTANINVDTLSSVVRVLIEDVQRDNMVLLEEAEVLLRLFDEFESIVNDQ